MAVVVPPFDLLCNNFSFIRLLICYTFDTLCIFVNHMCLLAQTQEPSIDFKMIIDNDKSLFIISIFA